MNPHETSDFTRGIGALRRWWWIPMLALVAGVLLGLTTRGDEESATFEAVVPTPTVDLSIGTLVGPPPPVDAIVAELQSPETVEGLGDEIDGVSVAATVAPDKSSVSVRGTGPDADSAQRGTEAYATALAGLYHDYVAAEAARVQESLDAGILTLIGSTARNNPNGPENAAKLAELQVQRQALKVLMEDEVEPPTARQISSSGSSSTTIVMLALAFGLLAAGLVALSGLSTRRLRYRDDIERVTGPHTLLSELTGNARGGSTARVLERLAGSGRVTLVPVGARSLDDVRQGLVGDSSADIVLARPLGDEEHVASVGGPAVLVVRLGKDTSSDLDLAHREFSSAGGTFAGVVAIDPGAGRKK